jgi:cytochrome c-type biogenesis protein CcsB
MTKKRRNIFKTKEIHFQKIAVRVIFAYSSLSKFMNIFSLENFFGNSSFFFLFLSMIAYWVQIAFHVQKWNIGRISMIGANFCLLSLLILRWKESGHFPLSNLYESLIFLAWSLSTFHLILETIESGSNQKFSTNHISFQLQQQSKVPILTQSSGLEGETKRFFVGAFTSPTALFINAFATFQLPIEMQQSSPLVPALQSNWLMMHVTVMILSYSALICGSLLSIAFLIVTKNLQFESPVQSPSPAPSLPHSQCTAQPLQGKGSRPNNETNRKPGLSNSDPCSGEKVVSVLGTSSFLSNTQKKTQYFSAEMQMASQPTSILEFPEISNSILSMVEKNTLNSWENILGNGMESSLQMKKKFAENLDNLSYRILGIGFPFLTIGILSGAVWANEAWGSYWSWDPKETWAFATWLVFAIYLHLRISKGWRGKKPAILASVGFVIVWICFLGVNLLGEGLHSYGFLKNSFS